MQFIAHYITMLVFLITALASILYALPHDNRISDLSTDEASTASAWNVGDTINVGDSTYTVTDPIYIGPVTPGGPNVYLNGAAGSIMEQLREKNANYDNENFGAHSGSIEDLLAHLPADLPANLAKSLSESAQSYPNVSLVRRDTPPPTNHACGWNEQIPGDWSPVDYMTAIGRITGALPTSGSASAGGHSCSPLTDCTKAQLWYCNDNPFPKIVWSSDIFTRFAVTFFWCFNFVAIAGRTDTSGQTFYDDNTNVILRKC